MFPLTITPRYIPGTAKTYNSNTLADAVATGWALPTDRVPDADEITPPVSNTASPATISVSIDAGLDGLTIVSHTHNIIATRGDSANNSNVHQVTLADSTVPSDRDFKLSWSPPPINAPVAAVFRQDVPVQDNTHSFASFMLMPPQQIFSSAQVPRELVFVMDTSQSMSGNSIRQAREALTLGIERLADDDIFNVIEFDNIANKLFAQAVAASAENKNIAINWVGNLRADNGTEILGALQMALNSPPAADRLKQIVFVTDGSVGNEDEIFQYLQNHIGTTRLFTVGIGSAPNTWFMRKAAETGRGTFTTIANAREMTTKMQQLLTRLERPALTDIKLSFDTDSQPEIYPAILPDVYMGEPVLADARWINKLNGGSVEISGKYAGSSWSQKLRLHAIDNDLTEQTSDTRINASIDTTGLSKLWAYRKIQSLENQLLFNINPAELEESITNIALSYSLVTKFTFNLGVVPSVKICIPLQCHRRYLPVTPCFFHKAVWGQSRDLLCRCCLLYCLWYSVWHHCTRQDNLDIQNFKARRYNAQAKLYTTRSASSLCCGFYRCRYSRCRCRLHACKSKTCTITC